MIPYSIIAVILVFVVCALIDLARQYTVEIPYIMFVNRYSEKIMKPITMIINFFRKIVFGK